jgi:hypothetical protein
LRRYIKEKPYMRFIAPKIHGIIDILVIIFLFGSPTFFGFTGLIATFTYVLGIIHLLLTLLTDYSIGVVKVIPFPVHGIIEFVVGVALIALAYTVFSGDPVGKLYYVIFGTVILLTWLCTDYNNTPKAV